jgi:hypothetical protein
MCVHRAASGADIPAFIRFDMVRLPHGLPDHHRFIVPYRAPAGQSSAVAGQLC